MKSWHIHYWLKDRYRKLKAMGYAIRRGDENGSLKVVKNNRQLTIRKNDFDELLGKYFCRIGCDNDHSRNVCYDINDIGSINDVLELLIVSAEHDIEERYGNVQ